ncbi:non-canonical purine NTP pyrophosphatase [Synechococcus sp. RSCCF101]|uniref:non-canonical purine NTP pyrophosphatase n=1 Tax=Synechococcus sp. RSCCF101 TaxID=2511069 RepID=UPI00124945BB|nr:non-canonical purine NTP pyrophosphatase [Synechococcus sp. RSCCF101]QEY31342.1 non-canonical purine NTP pyrophosphatase [Synechococcus sp. RSCCF101]
MSGPSSAAVPGPSPLQELVIASSNPIKVEDLTTMLQPLGLGILPLPEGLEIEETGSTYAENARLKASGVARVTGHWSLADDSGLEVDALGGAPGVLSARYAPTAAERNARLLQELGSVPYRSAAFVSAMALADPSGAVVLEAEGACRGSILTRPIGPCEGYAALFWLREAAMTYAELPQHLRFKLGSRGRAAREMAERLRALISG